MQSNIENQPKRILDPKNEPLVDVPTIIVRHLPGGSNPQAFVQWYGEYDLGPLTHKQFFFPIPADVELPLFFDDPEGFSVVMFARAKEWPMHKTRQELIKTAGSPEAFVLWIVLGGALFQRKAEEFGFHRSVCGKLECIITMDVKVAASGYGIIRPQKYLDIGVLLDGTELTGFCSDQPHFAEKIIQEGGN